MTPSTTAPEQRGVEAPRANEEATQRVALGLSYDGSAFHGFAPQRHVATVAGALSSALQARFSIEAHLTAAGRTDTGVHALSQVVHVDLPRAGIEKSIRHRFAPGDELPELARVLANQLRPHVVVYRAVAVGDDFDARHGALARRYRYDIETSARIDPLRHKGCWHLGSDLDLAAMRIGTDPLVGEHDFAGFCRQPAGEAPGQLKRRVHYARWRQVEPGWLRFEIESKAFCHQMVRSIVGTLVEIGQHRRSPAEVTARLRSGSRVGAAKLAPPHGLCLIGVRYPEKLGGDWL